MIGYKFLISLYLIYIDFEQEWIKIKLKLNNTILMIDVN